MCRWVQLERLKKSSVFSWRSLSAYLSARMDSGLTNLLVVSLWESGLVDEWRTVDIACFDFIKAFDTVSLNILVEKLLKYGLDK